MTEAQKCLYHIAENMRMDKSISKEGYEYFQQAIKALEQTRWIPISERLPEQYKEVIVTDIETTDTYLSQYIGNGHWECDNGLFNNRIIAWMPLPEPYKAERSEKK